MGNEQSRGDVGDDVEPQTLKARNLEAVAELIRNGDVVNIVCMTGAGISTSAGIPDFRSPNTGLYANLARLNLPYPEAVFDISFFKQNPKPFYTLAKELYPGKFTPTPSHAFISLLAKKGLLLKLFTQNIDCLERSAGVPDDLIIEAHGSFAKQRCIECKTEYPSDLLREKVEAEQVPYCEVPQCNGLVKPDIVFFGEPLPEAFVFARELPAMADLCIIMGTSLSVHPFASLPGFVKEGVPRVLFNLDRAGDIGSRTDDVSVLGYCDAGVRKLCDALGWREELEELWKSVGGGEKSEETDNVDGDERTKDEKMQDEITRLTAEVERTLKLSSGHQKFLENCLATTVEVQRPLELSSGHKNVLEDHLATKIDKGPSIVADVEGNAETGTKGLLVVENPHPDNTNENHDALVASAERVLQALNTPEEPKNQPSTTYETILAAEEPSQAQAEKSAAIQSIGKGPIEGAAVATDKFAPLEENEPWQNADHGTNHHALEKKETGSRSVPEQRIDGAGIMIGDIQDVVSPLDIETFERKFPNVSL